MRKPFRVKKYKHPRLKFIVTGREADKRKRKFFTEKQDALTYCQRKNIEAENTGRAGAEFPERLRIMAQDCAERLNEHGKTLADATAHYLALLKATEKSCTAAELVAKLLTAKRADGASARYLSDLKHRLTRFANDFNGQVVATISGAQIDDWLRALNQSPTSRNNYRRVLNVAFTFAVKEGYALTSPEMAIANTRDKAPGILTIAEIARLLENASLELLPYLAIGAFAGLRRAELDRLGWSDVDFDSDLIEVTAANAKSARRRLVPMQPNLREWLLPVRQLTGRIACVNLRKQLEAAQKAAGISEWPSNALRHSFASYHVAHFKNTNALALEMGHTDSKLIFKHYRALVKPKVAERYWNIKPAPTENVVSLIAG